MNGPPSLPIVKVRTFRGEAAMWICIRCRAEISVDAAEPGIDDFGIYFICPHCGRRNKLINVSARNRNGRRRGGLLLQQTGN